MVEPYSWRSEAGNVWPVSSVLLSQMAGGCLWSVGRDSEIKRDLYFHLLNILSFKIVSQVSPKRNYGLIHTVPLV